MKKFFIMLLFISLGFGLISCGNNQDSNKDNNENNGESNNGGENNNNTNDNENNNNTGDGELNDERSIEVDYEQGVLYVPTERNIKVAQFADAHFGVDNKAWHNDKMARTKKYMSYVVETSKPDFIVCSGDNIIGTGITNNAAGTHDLTEFVEFMESLKTPWTFMYGNHDAETKSKKAYSEFFLECIETGKTEYLLYKEDYIEEANLSVSSSDEGRYGNFVIPVYDLDDKTKLLGGYIFFDAGTYLYDLGEYQTITSGQVSWYEEKINELQQEYKGSGVVPTIVFSHIQIPEFKKAYHEAYYNQTEGYEFVVRQDLAADDFKTVSYKANEEPTTDNGLFEKMVALGSTKAYFIGHAHDYYFQVKSHGILLGYAPQCGFSKLFASNYDARKTYVYNVSSDFSFTSTTVVEEENLGEGLALKYFDGTNGDRIINSTLDSETGIYKISFQLYQAWCRFQLYVDNKAVAVNDSTYTISGDYQNACDASSFTVYPGNDKITLLYPNSTKVNCIVTYNPTTKEINIDVEEPKIPEGTVLANKVNTDAGGDAMAVWTTAGTKMKTVTNTSNGSTTWVGNGWRLYIICDSEGKIVYMVMHPVSGYGGPSGASYYSHSSYASDYTTNPAFNILDGYGPWVLGGFAHNLYEVKIPTGGFAITAHGNANYLLFDLLGINYTDLPEDNPSTPDTDEYTVALLQRVNSRTALGDNIRISFDASTKLVAVYGE